MPWELSLLKFRDEEIRGRCCIRDGLFCFVFRFQTMASFSIVILF